MNSSVVVLARDVNQSIFKPAWLLKTGILLEEELDARSIVFAPGITRVPSPMFELLVLPDRIQMRFPPDSHQADALLSRVLGGIVRTLPHTPFAAVGLNFQHEVTPADASGFYEWNKRAFAAPWAMRNTDDNSRTRYGCSFAYDAFGGARMRVRAAVSARSSATPNDGAVWKLMPYVVSVHCNLHRDLPTEDTTRELTRMLSIWQKVRDETVRLVASLSDAN